MGEPLVSAVIITYNQEKYIEQTIECALAQKVDFEYEIIIGEDCSTDRTREICLQYQKKYPDIIRVISSDKNVGLLDNWYRSVKAARGKYIAGCGGDDYWHNPEKIQKQADFLEKNSDFGMVHSDADILYQNTGKIEKNIHLVRKNLFKNTLEEILTGNKIIASSVLFKKEIFEKKFNISEIKKKKFLIEDIPLWAEIASSSRIYYMKNCFVTYRVVDGSISRNKSDLKKIDFFKSCYDCVLFYFDKYIYLFEDKYRVLFKIHLLYNIYIFNLAFHMNKRDIAEFCYRNLIINCGKKHLPISLIFKRYILYIPFGFIMYEYLYDKIYVSVKNILNHVSYKENLH